MPIQATQRISFSLSSHGAKANQTPRFRHEPRGSCPIRSSQLAPPTHRLIRLRQTHLAIGAVEYRSLIMVQGIISLTMNEQYTVSISALGCRGYWLCNREIIAHVW